MRVFELNWPIKKKSELKSMLRSAIGENDCQYSTLKLEKLVYALFYSAYEAVFFFWRGSPNWEKNILHESDTLIYKRKSKVTTSFQKIIG